jgi:Coenzyme PQQ synthesis protein D (PqqD)
MHSAAPQWRDLRDARISVPDHVVFREMAQETVLLNIRTGRYHGIDPVGAHFFEVMRSGDPLARVAARLADDYKQPIDRIEQDLAAFCTRMAELELIELHGDPS